MKTITLETLTLTNFKGVKSFSLNAGGESVDVYGENESGKTTLADAFLYLFFGKNAEGRKDFAIKALDADGQESHNLDHIVDATIMIDDQAHTLKRVYREKWSKRRGNPLKSFTGHTTEYFIDGVPRSEKEYRAWVDEVIGEDLFRLLTDPRFFCGQHWETQREAMLNICGDVNPADIIQTDKKLTPLADHLKNMTADDRMAILKASAKAINEELTLIPARIDECNKALDAVDDGVSRDVETIEEALKIARESRQEHQKQRLESLHGGDIARLSADLVAAKAKRDGIVNDHRNSVSKRANELQLQINKLLGDQDRNQVRIDNARKEIAAKEDAAKKAGAAIEETRAKWKTVNAEVFIHQSYADCPYCGATHEHQLKHTEEAMRNHFNGDKARRLGQINEDGRILREKIGTLQNEIAALHADITTAETVTNEIKASLADMETKQRDIQNEMMPLEWDTAAWDVNDLEYQIDLAKNPATIPDTSAIDNLIAQDEADEKLWLERLEAQRTREKTVARISELEKQEKRLVKEFEALQLEFHLWDTYTRARCDMLEEKINSRFALTKWRLWEKQINEGVKPTCVALKNGVPWPDMNNAGRHQIGIDIINTLSEHHGVICPIWLDNRESTTTIPETKAQIINLYVYDKAAEIKRQIAAIENLGIVGKETAKIIEALRKELSDCESMPKKLTVEPAQKAATKKAAA